MSDTSPSPPSPGLSSDPSELRQRDRTFPVQDGDWIKLREKVANLKEPVPYLAAVGWTCGGLAVGALLSLLAWLFINSALPVKVYMRYEFITPLLIITSVAGLVIVAFTLAVWRQIKQIRVTTITDVLDDMDAIYEPYSHTTS